MHDAIEGSTTEVYEAMTFCVEKVMAMTNVQSAQLQKRKDALPALQTNNPQGFGEKIPFFAERSSRAGYGMNTLHKSQTALEIGTLVGMDATEMP